MRRTILLSAAAFVACLATPLLAQTPASPPVQTQTSTPTAMPATSTSQTPPAPSVMPSAQPGTPSRSIADSDHGTSIVLLQHIQKVLDDAVNGKTGQVSIERSMLDELRAELTQVRLALQLEKP